MSPHPADPTLTADNLMEVVKELDDRHSNDLSNLLGVRQRLRDLFRDPKELLAESYVTQYPMPSWIHVAGVLQGMGLHKQADEVTTKYVKGMDVNHVMCMILIQAVDGLVDIKLISVI